MDIERALLSKVIQSSNVAEALEANVRPDFFEGEARAVWEWLLRHFGTYSVVPGTQALAHAFPEYELDAAPTEAIPVYVDLLRRKFIHNSMLADMRKVYNILDKGGNVDAAVEQWHSTLLNIEEANTVEPDLDWAESTELRLRRYEEAKSSGGIIGRRTPFPGLNNATGGRQPGELWLVIGKSGTGKSWMETLMAVMDYEQGGSPILFSKEMMAIQFAQRLDAVAMKLPYGSLRRGLLNPEDEARWRQGLEALKSGGRGLKIVGDPRGGVAHVAAKIQRYKPTSVYIDGMYLMEDDQESDAAWQQITNIARDLKRLAKSQKIDIVATVQFNRKGKTSDDIAYGDIQKECDVLAAIYQDEDQRLSNIMELKALKVREGPTGQSWQIRWDFDTMTFGELTDQGIVLDGFGRAQPGQEEAAGGESTPDF